MHFRSYLVATVLGAALSSNCFAQFDPRIYYVDSVTVEDLDELFDMHGSLARDINDTGDVVGDFKINTTRHAFVLRNGQVYDTDPTHPQRSSYGRGINNVGEAVGYFDDVVELGGFYWTEGTGRLSLSSSLYPGEPYDDEYSSAAYAINQSGVISGRVFSLLPVSDIPYDPCHWRLPVRWVNQSSLPQKLYCPSIGTHFAFDINNSGVIVGLQHSANESGFVWTNGTTAYVPKPSGARQYLVAYGINDAGVVVGAANLGSDHRALWWDGVSATSKWMGVLPGGDESLAFEVNEQRMAAGRSEMLVAGGNLAYIVDRAFLWHTHFGMYALPIPPQFASTNTQCGAYSLNNRETSTGRVQVVGYCSDAMHGMRAIRWNVIVKKKFLSLP